MSYGKLIILALFVLNNFLITSNAGELNEFFNQKATKNGNIENLPIKDKYILLFAADWCGSCKAQLPAIKEILNYYTVIIVSMDRSVEAAQTLYKKTNSSWYMLDWNVGQRQHIKTLNNWNMTVVDFVEKGKARFSVTGNLLLVTGKKVAASNEVIIEMKEAFDKINGWCPSSVFNGAIPQMTLLDSDGKILKDEQGQISGYNLQNIVKRIIDLK